MLINIEYDFSTVGAVGIGAFLTSLSVNFGSPATPNVAGFSALLDGHALTAIPNQTNSFPITIPGLGTFTEYTVVQGLAGGSVAGTSANHQLFISGTSAAGGSFGGNLSVASVAAVSAVPLPAGIWLFMTGLVGLLYTGKRKAQQA